jgi:hypothetical protein
MNFVSTINTAEVNIVMGNNLQVSSTMTEGANVTLTSGGSTYQAKIDESYLNYNTELTSTYVNVSIADSANTIHQGKYQGFVWSGVLEFTDKTLDPVNDMGFSPTDFTILNAALQIPYEGVGGTVPVTFSRFTGTVKTDSTVKTFPNNATISFHTSANGGKGLTLEQKNQIKSATKIQVIATLKNGYTSSNGVCTLTTDISDAGPAATVSRGTSSVTFDVPKELFYDSKYDETATSIKLYLYGASLSAPEFTSVNIILTLGTPTTTTTATTTPAPVSSTAATTTPAPAADGTDVADTELVLNYTTLTLNKGSSIYLKANYDNVKWTKSGAAIKLYTSGKVTGAAVGTATVYATNAAGEKVACKVNVIESKVPATAIALKTTSGTVYVDSSYNLNSYTITPSSSDDAKNLTWSTSDPSVATVDSNGKVKVVGLGKATITVTTPSGKTSAAVLTAKNPSLTLKTASGTVSAGKQLQISSTAAPSSSKVTYESQDETIATVNATGVITGVKAGSTQIQVTSSKGIVKVFNVTVK